MGVRKTKLPAVPAPTNSNILQVLEALKEIVEVGASSVTRGDPLDAYVTFRDVQNGLGASNAGSVSDGGGFTPTPPGGGGGPFPPPIDTGDIILPGRPMNVRTSAVFDGIMVKWDWPDTTNPNVGWDRAAVHASATTSFANGAIVGYTATNFFVHPNIGLSDPEGGLTGVRYYWVRFERSNVAGELEVTEWTPYEFESGVRGQTATSFVFSPDTFGITDPNTGEVYYPFMVGEIVIGYDEAGEPIMSTAVALNGQFIVNGTITAMAIQAGSIGAREINAQEISTAILTANAVFSGTLATRPPPDFRVEINGQGTTYEHFPLWYGRGETGGEQGLFWFQLFQSPEGLLTSSMFLGGDLFVTGAGRFFAGNVLYDEDGAAEPDLVSARVEIGGPNTDFLMWAGSGPTGVSGASLPIFYIGKDGSAVFKGTVEARFVSGEVSRTALINDPIVLTLIPRGHTNTASIPENHWQQVQTWELPAPPFDSGHIPFLNLQFQMYGSGQQAGASRILYCKEQGGPWFEISRTVHDLHNYGGLRGHDAVIPERVYGRCWVRFDASGFDGFGPTVDGPRGIVWGIR